MTTPSLCAADLFHSVPGAVWRAAFEGACGYLPNGDEAKMPIASVGMDLNPDQFADPEAFALRVACMLKFYGYLTHDMADNFHKVLVVGSKRAKEFMHEDVSALPGLCVPESAVWGEVVSSTPRKLAAHVEHIFIKGAKEYSEEMLRVPFHRLSLNCKAFVLHHVAMEEPSSPAKDAEKSAEKEKSIRKTLRSIQECIEKGADIEALLDVINEEIKETKSNEKRRRMD